MQVIHYYSSTRDADTEAVVAATVPTFASAPLITSFISAWLESITPLPLSLLGSWFVLDAAAAAPGSIGEMAAT